MCDDKKLIGEDIAVYLDIVSQVEERYGYQHRLPPEVKVYVDSIADCAVSERPAAQRVAKSKQKERENRGSRKRKYKAAYSTRLKEELSGFPFYFALVYP